jgi:hypothetical protein
MCEYMCMHASTRARGWRLAEKGLPVLQCMHAKHYCRRIAGRVRLIRVSTDPELK